jgi:hypothetical protein
MEAKDLQWIERYAHRLNDSSGDMGVLSKDERLHFRLLIRKYELEQQLAKADDTLAQGKLELGENADES